MANTLAGTSIYQADLSGFKKPIVPAPKPQGNQNYSASSYLNNAPAFQQVALWMAKWNSPQAETQARYGGSPKSSKSTQSSSKPKQSQQKLPTMVTSPKLKSKVIVWQTGKTPLLPWGIAPDELYKNTVIQEKPLQPITVTPKVATTTTPVVSLSKQTENAYTPTDYSDIDSMDIKGLKDYQRSVEYDIQHGKPLNKEQQLKLLYAQDRVQELIQPQAIPNPIVPLIEQEQQAKAQRQTELQQEQDRLIQSQQENERQYIESQNILFKQAEDEQKKVMWYILWWQWAETSSYWAEQLNKIGMNFAWQKQALIAESNARLQKYRAELSWATRQELDQYDNNINNLKLQSAQYDVDNMKLVNAYNIQEWQDLNKRFDILYQTAQAQAISREPLTQDQIDQAWYYASFLVKQDWSLDNNILDLLQKTNPSLINSAIQQWVAIQKEREWQWYTFSNIGWWQIAVQNPKTWKVEFIQWNRQNEYDYQKDTAGNVYAINKNNPSDTRIVVWQPSEWAIWDLTYLRSQFPTEARSGTNNPAGITWNNNFEKWTWSAAILLANGIEYEKGNPRPKNEWWNYVKFKTIDDGLKAQRLIMTQTYGNNTVQGMLDKRVGTGNVEYAKSIASKAGIPLQARVSDLNESQVAILQSAKLERESPWLYKVLLWVSQWSTQPKPSNYPQYANYIETWKLPTWMKDSSPQADMFKSQALEWYLTNKEQELNGLWLTISNPTAFSSTVANTPKRKAINEALSVVPAFTNTMDQLIALTDKYWTELIPWNAKNQMSMLVKDAQLQAKEIYNLWVLNWPDLSLMESIIANPADWTAKWQQLFGVSFKKSLENAKAKIMDNAIEKAKSIWLAPIWTQTQANSDPLWLWI